MVRDLNGYPVFRYQIEYRIAGSSGRIIRTECDATTLKAIKRNRRLIRIIRKREIPQWH